MAVVASATPLPPKRSNVGISEGKKSKYRTDIELYPYLPLFSPVTSVSPAALIARYIMKFSHSLQFNAVPEWSSKYIAYSQLKKLIYSLQKEKLYQDAASSDPERAPLNKNYTSRFLDALDQQLYKIDKFFASQETGILANYHELNDDVQEFQSELLNRSSFSMDSQQQQQQQQQQPKQTHRRSSASSVSMNRAMSYSDDDEDDEEEYDGDNPGTRLVNSILHEVVPSMSRTTNFTNSDPMLDIKITLKKRLVAIFTQLSELKSFIDLNHTGFSKICKKFDKSLDTSIKSQYLPTLSQKTHVFQPETLKNLENCINDTIVMYAKLLSNGDPSQDVINFQEAERQLGLHLREHVVWERNTVWKDMMNLERKAQNIKTERVKKKPSPNFKEDQPETSPSPTPELPSNINDALQMSPHQYVRLILQSTQFLKFLLITSVFIVLLVFSPFADLLQKNCFAILVYASLLWATETIPLFVTSLLVPLLVVFLPVLKNSSTGKVMTPAESSQYILSTMWSSVIMLLLGGFTLAAALSKYNVAKVISTHILSSAGTNPKMILLTNMGVALFVSMWVSNVAAPVLCYSIIQPLLRTLPKGSSFAKSLILGIALASNIGGMASPIASPQNIISIGMMDPQPSWGQWFIVSLPVCVICIFGIWVLLLLTFPSDPNLKILQLHPIKEPFTIQQWFVTLCTIGTIALWCLAKQLSGIFGEMGIISIIPMVLLFGTGMLTSDDFNNFMWTIVILAMGGTTLGKSVTSSGLLASMASLIKDQVQDKPVFVIVLVFGIVILTMATFVSHTVAAMIIVPLMSEIGSKLPSGDHSRLLIMLAAFLCSGAMGLPTSGFPNVTAISMIDDVGDRYLTVGNFITRGVPASVLTYFVIVTIGYGLMKLIGY